MFCTELRNMKKDFSKLWTRASGDEKVTQQMATRICEQLASRYNLLPDERAKNVLRFTLGKVFNSQNDKPQAIVKKGEAWKCIKKFISKIDVVLQQQGITLLKFKTFAPIVKDLKNEINVAEHIIFLEKAFERNYFSCFGLKIQFSFIRQKKKAKTKENFCNYRVFVKNNGIPVLAGLLIKNGSLEVETQTKIVLILMYLAREDGEQNFIANSSIHKKYSSFDFFRICVNDRQAEAPRPHLVLSFRERCR